MTFSSAIALLTFTIVPIASGAPTPLGVEVAKYFGDAPQPQEDFDPIQKWIYAQLAGTAIAQIQLKYEDYGEAPLPDPSDLFITTTHILHCRHMVTTMNPIQDDPVMQWHLGHCQGDYARAVAYQQAHPLNVSDAVCTALFPPRSAMVPTPPTDLQLKQARDQIQLQLKQMNQAADVIKSERGKAAEEKEVGVQSPQYIWSKYKTEDEGVAAAG
eukprot:CAMPEP_0183358974 /NCGR_PEP_ID=MMETSP0164_2-20130417/50902_1 /TAXON_ID=221442 /ORGANISM="Coccolithus pelagicus ssp braarudi, Strain PLY182g" /LENGTH=213 /DNA_ID=CAMNT_0025532987 /DNA_START=94 /DNA_END=731 /DNA_ORIENTATION=+